MKAKARADVTATILRSRKLPCICPRQFEKDATNTARAIGYSDGRGILVESVECSRCLARWRRIHCK